MYKYHSDSLKESELIEAQNEFIILEKGHALDSRGSTHVFYQRNRNLSLMQLDLFTINRHKDKVSYYRVWSRSFRFVNMFHPFTIRITPQHHSSTIEFEDKSKPLHTSLDGPEEFKEILRGLTCGAFIHELLTDTNIKGIIDQLLCEVKGIYSKYSDFQDSPDGIQDVILHCNTQTSYFCKETFRTALIDANFVDPENYFDSDTEGQHICYGAMQKPFKMIQIANALLPPIVWNEGASRQVELIDYNNQKEDLLPPNSFYVQAYVNDGVCTLIRYSRRPCCWKQ
ncbi:hypothetical protein MAM1_0107c05454 [Mucor ambiguus]|uniref:Uncharacterized protein n=1 Tax=Mucor ambiguus TaxID=91626 RepID=A0A0C9MV24_9FUNG|nr:hypothetical protein MAM1_0107c05454 [Mucor ambiguus]